MFSLEDKRQFIVENLNDLGAWLELDLSRHVRSVENHSGLRESFERAVAPVDFFKTKHWDNLLWLAGLYRTCLYAIARELAPEHTVETGVLHGISSAFVLQGLIDGGNQGTLHSIDYPSTFEDGPVNEDGYTDTLPPNLTSGWIIDESLRSCWSLKQGPSSDLLPQVLGVHDQIDWFIHDSDHSYANMAQEFEQAWPAIRSGGILLADNIDTNTAFFDFCRRVDKVPYVLPADPDHLKPLDAGIRVGLIVK
ncbi:MAG: class I SAM-dependent methyltransferase [Rhodospirillales bacterium]